MTTTAPVRSVAKAILQKSSIPVSNLKLQKLLYYVQGWSLALDGIPAFNERVEAWVHGPVVPEIFHAYRHFRWNPIDVPAEPVGLPEPMLTHIENTLMVYGGLTASQLETLSHEETPWKEARAGLGPCDLSNVVISQEAMRAYFVSRMNA